MAVTWQDTPVVLGGWRTEGANPKVATDKVWRVVNSRWTELPPLLQPRAAAAAAVVGDRIIVTGGVDADGKLLNTTEIFDGSSWKLGAPMPTPRQMLGAASDGKLVYAVGGTNGTVRPGGGRGVRPRGGHVDEPARASRATQRLRRGDQPMAGWWRWAACLRARSSRAWSHSISPRRRGMACRTWALRATAWRSPASGRPSTRSAGRPVPAMARSRRRPKR